MVHKCVHHGGKSISNSPAAAAAVVAFYGVEVRQESPDRVLPRASSGEEHQPLLRVLLKAVKEATDLEATDPV